MVVTAGPELEGSLGDAVLALLDAHRQEMLRVSPPGSVFALKPDELRSPDITMWSLWSRDVLAGCGALKELDDTSGEIKSMRTDTPFLRQGVGAAILQAILDEARSRSFEWLYLETGRTEDFAAARRLYARFGFRDCGPFGSYRDNAFSHFMKLRL